MTEQGYPPRQPDHPGRPGRSRTSQEPRRSGWQVIDAFGDDSDYDSDLPPWAGPGIEPLRPARRSPRVPDWDRMPEPDQFDDGDQVAGPGQDRPGRLRRLPGRGRAAAARRRRSKRRLVTWGAVAIVLVIFTGLGIYLAQSPAPKSRYVTTLQKGEFRAVPDACNVVGKPVLRQLMNGTPTSIQPQQGQVQSQCTYTVDVKPTFRVLNVEVQAMRASLVPVGDGSATADAKYTFAQQRSLLARPPKHTPQPPATISPVSGVGDEAFSAVQNFRASTVIDLVTVWVRYRNVLIMVKFQGQSSGGFGPVTVTGLRSGALTVARAALVDVKGEATV